MTARMEKYGHCMNRLEELGCRIGKSVIRPGQSSSHLVIEHRVELPQEIDFEAIQNEFSEATRHNEKSGQSENPLFKGEGNCFFRFEVSPLSEGFTPEQRDELHKISDALGRLFYVQRRIDQGVKEEERLSRIKKEIAFHEPKVRKILGLKL